MIVPHAFKKVILILLSILFYAWGDVSNLLYLVIASLIVYVTGLELEECFKTHDLKQKRIVFFGSVILLLGMLAFFKYAGLMSMPIGVSFFTFSLISYLADVYMKKAEVEHNILNYLLYVTYFPKLISGPIVQYHTFKEELSKMKMTKSKFSHGVMQFVLGLVKKVLVADIIAKAFNGMNGISSMSVLGSWLMVVFYALQLYFDFSGYSDMAIGLSYMFGMRMEDNFNEPYTSKSVSEFWRRWHISLGHFFRDYVYIPLGGNRCPTGRQIFNLMVVWLLTGIWHGNTICFLVWGLYHGIIICLEKFVYGKGLKRLNTVWKVIYTDVLVFIGWVFFFSTSIGKALNNISHLFGVGVNGFVDSTFLYYFTSYFWVLIFAIVLCVPKVRELYRKYTYQKSLLTAYLSVVLYLGAFILCIAYIVSSTYSSFLYFKF
jgi:alginate O-acetyltransferase complex protein AlgI